MQETSLDAYNSLLDTLPKVDAKILAEVKLRGVAGSTCDEAEVNLEMRHQTCSAGFTRLKQKGIINDSGMRRRTRSKRFAIVWELSERYYSGTVLR